VRCAGADRAMRRDKPCDSQGLTVRCIGTNMGQESLQDSESESESEKERESESESESEGE
jgi:hypothetical protein